MQLTDIPAKFPVPFANSAGGSYVASIPTADPGGGRASLNLGFPPVTFEQIGAGGNPPFGKDMNGILQQATAWCRWMAAGGALPARDAAFQSAVGGYPQYALLRAATFSNGRFWCSTADNNVTNPDAAGAGWFPWPDLPIQRQAPNYGADIGLVNQIKVNLDPAPTSWASIVGMPVRVGGIVATTTITNPTVQISTLTPAVIVNPDGSVLANGQIPLGCTMEGIPLASGKFQIGTPTKAVVPSATWPIPGFVMPWPSETPPAGFLECDGSSLLIASYPYLWAILGNRFGGDGVSTFKLPDFRGQFLRGWDHGRTGTYSDPDRASRADSGNGTTGDHVGTLQTGAAGPISIASASVTVSNLHFQAPGAGVSDFVANTDNGGDVGGGHAFGSITGQPIPVTSLTGTMALSGNSGNETRPINIYVMWVIKT